MATGINPTGMRTGASAPQPMGKPAPSGGLGKLIASWNGLSQKMKIIVVGSVSVFVFGIVGYITYSAANKPVSLYQTSLTPGDIQEVSQQLNKLGIPYKVEGTHIMVAPSEQPRIVGLLISCGLPHWTTGAAPEANGMTPKTEAEKRLAQIHDLESTLIDELRQVSFVADARVNIVEADDDTLTKEVSKATVMLKIRPGPLPSKLQIESVINLVASSVPGLMPENVRVTDTEMRVWNDGAKIANYGSSSYVGMSGGDSNSEGDVFGNENIAIKKAYERVYENKVRDALNRVLGEGKYAVTVDADIDFDQTKIETTQVGDPSGNGQVVTLSKRNEEHYDNTPKNGSDGKKKDVPTSASQQVSMGPGTSDPGADTNYTKVSYEQKVESSKVEKTAIIAPNVVKRLTATVAVDGKMDDDNKKKLASVVGGAMGINEVRGDTVNVVDMAFNHPNPLANADAGTLPPLPPGFENHGGSKPLLLMAMLVPTTILLSILTIFLLKQRRVQADRQGLVMTMGPGATTSDISDLLSDKIGRSTATSTTQTTRVNNTEQLEKLAKEKPTKVAELLKSTWLSDRER